MAHVFILQPGIWVGEGKITFSASPEHVRFYTKWIIQDTQNEQISCKQTVEMQGGMDPVYNEFTFSNMKSDAFTIELQNDLFGNLKGTGILETKTIAWEFRGHSQFEGFEVYELQDNGDYMLHAEYASPDLFRTIIDGRIWKKE